MKTRAISWLITFNSFSQAQTQKWPLTITPSPKLGTHSVEAAQNGFIYETSSFRIQTPKKIDSDLVTNFVMSAEATALALKSIPFALSSTSNSEKPLIQIALDEESYSTAGGASGTGGFYDGHRNRVIVRWDQLHRVPSQSALLRRPAFDLLVHELTHLGMRDKIWKIRPWLTEGIAEYLAAAHLVRGNFDFRKIDTQIRDHVRKQTGAKNQKIPLTNIEQLLKLSSNDWLKRTATLPPNEALESYTSALLLTHFTFHGGAERRQEFSNYLAELEKVILKRDQKPILFPIKYASSIQMKLKAYWSTRGLQLDFK